MTTKILCAVDGSDHANTALIAAAELAARLPADLSICMVNVLYGTSPRAPQVFTWTKEEADKVLADATALVTARGQKLASAKVISDREASTGIVLHAVEIDADHIVIGTGDKRGLERLVLGSVAKDVATRAHCTVTIVR